MSLLLNPSLVFAQTGNAGLTGVVTDPNGAVVVGARVEVKNRDDGKEQASLTDAAGRYSFTSLQAGVYQVSVSNKGFQTVSDDVSIRPGQTANADFVLKAGGLKETVQVAGEQEYRATRATTATKIDAALMETPVSIQVVPQIILREQQVTRIEQAVTNVSGVNVTNLFFGQFADQFVIRGFRTNQVLYRDGFRVDTGFSGKHDTANIEQLEVLKGPASILYGRIEPGGLINYVTKEPLSRHHYAIEQQFGSYDSYRTTLDATGPLVNENKLGYRLNFAYENSGSFREFVGSERWFVSPVVQWNINPATALRVEWDHFHNDTTPDNIGLIAFGNRPLNIPRTRNLGEPTDFQNAVEDIIGVNFSHGFNDRWKVDAHYNAVLSDEEDGGSFGDFVTDDDIRAGILPRTIEGSQIGLAETFDQHTHSFAANVTGKVATGGIRHTLLAGGDFYRNRSEGICCGINGSLVDDINIFAPVHGVTVGPVDPSFATPNSSLTRWYGLYLQDQIELPHQFYALAGFRYDNAREESSGFGDSKSHDDAVSPRVGLSWRPLGELSLYGSYVQNFGATNGSFIDRDNRPLPPETARQFEFGVKTELGKRFLATLSYFDLTKKNLLTADPLFPNDSVHALAIGKAKSHGLEVDLAGMLRPNWNLLANYAFTETEILNDSFLGTKGNRLANAPKHGGRVWTTYGFTRAPLDGLTLGGGVTARGLRQGDLSNDFQLPGFATLEIMASYRFQLGKTKLTLQLNGSNLLDKDYFEASAECCRSRILPGQPRSFIGAIRFDF